MRAVTRIAGGALLAGALVLGTGAVSPVLAGTAAGAAAAVPAAAQDAQMSSGKKPCAVKKGTDRRGAGCSKKPLRDRGRERSTGERPAGDDRSGSVPPPAAEAQVAAAVPFDGSAARVTNGKCIVKPKPKPKPNKKRAYNAAPGPGCNPKPVRGAPSQTGPWN